MNILYHKYMFKKIYNISDQGILCDFGNEINKEINLKVIGVLHYLNFNANINKKLGIINCVPSYNKILVQYDLSKSNSEVILKYISSIKENQILYQPNQKIIELPICYKEDYGIDLKSISENNKIDIEEIIELHSSTNFYVYMIGFMPGFPFMGDLSTKLFTSRLATPRVLVPERSVAIVEKFCGIYPFESPGGWNIVGRTPNKLFFKNKKKPTLFSPGSNVKFISISTSEFLKIESSNNE